MGGWGSTFTTAATADAIRPCGLSCLPAATAATPGVGRRSMGGRCKGTTGQISSSTRQTLRTTYMREPFAHQGVARHDRTNGPMGERTDRLKIPTSRTVLPKKPANRKDRPTQQIERTERPNKTTCRKKRPIDSTDQPNRPKERNEPTDLPNALLP